MCEKLSFWIEIVRQGAEFFLIYKFYVISNISYILPLHISCSEIEGVIKLVVYRVDLVASIFALKR